MTPNERNATFKNPGKLFKKKKNEREKNGFGPDKAVREILTNMLMWFNDILLIQNQFTVIETACILSISQTRNFI